MKLLLPSLPLLKLLLPPLPLLLLLLLLLLPIMLLVLSQCAARFFLHLPLRCLRFEVVGRRRVVAL